MLTKTTKIKTANAGQNTEKLDCLFIAVENIKRQSHTGRLFLNLLKNIICNFHMIMTFPF